MIENWQPIPQFETKYEVSDLGRIRNINTGLIKKLVVIAGYYYIGLSYKDRKSKSFRVHRLVAKAFIPNPLNLSQVNHIDCDKFNNNVSNLEWCTHEQNTIHRDLHNLSPKGEKTPFSKLTESDVIEMRRLRASGMKYDDIAVKFPVNKSVVCAICLRKSWKHVA
jgi:hypothetical protein